MENPAAASTAGLANRSLKNMVFWFFKKTKKVQIFVFFGFLIFEFQDPELVKIYSLVFLLTFTL
jgi:hypothetical protein